MKNTDRTFIIILSVSWFIELVIGILLLSWYWGTAWFAASGPGQRSITEDIAISLNYIETFNINTGSSQPSQGGWTPGEILSGLIVLFVVFHIGYALWFGFLTPKLERWHLGTRQPSQREQEEFDKAYRQLARSIGGFPITRPRLWHVADGMGMQMRWIGYILVIDRELLHHQYLVPLLAHELGHANAEDRLAHRLYAMLPRPVTIFVIFAGFAFGLGTLLLFPVWSWYWRERIYAADRFAVRCGQKETLFKALNELYLKLDTATIGGRALKPIPYIEQRIDRLK